jgi:16S rRNA C967 or C1407 C5-methylase (RsmB/RsmF family)
VTGTSSESVSVVTPGRTAALEVFGAVGRGQRVDRAFASAASDLDLRERAWCRELVYGAQRLRGRLDYLLDRRVRRGLDSVDAEVLNVMRLGVYQVLYMDGVPEYAAVSQTVDLARLVGGQGASGFVNAIMRATVREKPGEEHFPDFVSDPAGYLSTWGSHPRWLVERWLERWPAVDVRRLVEANNAVPPIYLRCFRDTPAEAARRLSDAGIAATPVGLGTECVMLHAGSSPIEAMAVVSSVVQDMILVDVPCTGTGTLRRNPDARWRLTPGRMEELVKLQGRILEANSVMVPDGGLLVYSTCSLEPEENEDQIGAFLSIHPEFELEPGAGVGKTYLDERGQLFVLPQRTGFDGAFAARLRKRSGHQG